MKEAAGEMVLAIDCSGPTGSVAVGRGGSVTVEISLTVRASLSSALMPAVDYAMKSANVTATDLRKVVVGAGPGSFTGLRVAAASAKGIVHALGLPLVAHSSLLAAAAPFAAHRGAVGVLFDARGRDVFAGCYTFGTGGVKEMFEPAAMSLEEALARFAENAATLVVGEGTGRHDEEIRTTISASIVPAAFSAPRAGALLWLAEDFPETGADASSADWEPDYLRASGAERIAAEAARAKAATVSSGE